MSTLAERVVAVARSQIGVREDGAVPNDGEPSRVYMGGRQEAWCAWFVAFCFRRAGRPLPGDVEPAGLASPLAGVAYTERLFIHLGWNVVHPMAGDVVFFARRGASDRGPGRHCGIIEDATAFHMVRTVEGNVGDSVRSVTYRRTTLEQLATSYGRVPELIQGSK